MATSNAKASQTSWSYLFGFNFLKVLVLEWITRLLRVSSKLMIPNQCDIDSLIAKVT